LKCKFCKNNNITTLKKILSPHLDLNYSLYQCNECKCRFFDDKEYGVNIYDIYDKYPQNMQYMNSIFVKSMYWSCQKNRIIKYLDDSPTSVLDVGCRTGDFLMHFNPDIIRDGVEITKEYACIARDRGLNIYNNRLEDVKFNKTYEVVSAFGILEHLVEPFKFLDKCSELVAINGVLIIAIPTYENIKTYLIDRLSNVRWLMYSPPEHLNLFSKLFLDKYLKEKGFQLVNRYWTSGGTFNPFLNIPVLGFLFKGFMFLYDESFCNKIPIFDHLYSIYKFKGSTR